MSDPIITRIEFRVYPMHNGGIQVSKFPDGWTAATNPVERSIQRQKSLDEMCEWLAERGWTVYRWPASKELGVAEGATAFRGKPIPKRTRSAIIELRSQLERKAQAHYRRYSELSELPINLSAIDLAYQL